MQDLNPWTLIGFRYRPQLLGSVDAMAVGALMTAVMPSWLTRAISTGQVRLCRQGAAEFVEIIRLGAPPIIVREGDYLVHHNGAYSCMPKAMFEALFTNEQKVVH